MRDRAPEGQKSLEEPWDLRTGSWHSRVTGESCLRLRSWVPFVALPDAGPNPVYSLRLGSCTLGFVDAMGDWWEI
jgi:hypothetical protein